MNKNFAKHLSGVLEGMNYTQGIKIIEGLVDKVAVIEHDTEELGEYENYSIRFETNIMVEDKMEFMLNGNFVNLLEKYGIEGFYYRIEINPTEEEMTELLDAYSAEYEEEDLFDATVAEVERLLCSYNFDVVMSYFEDVRITWDVLVDEDGNFYRAGCDELMSY